MYHSGIGGGGFALVRDSNGNYETIDYREAAPAAAFENMYKGNLQGAVTGGLAVAVPGDLKGLEYLHERHGVSDVQQLLAVHKGLLTPFIAATVESGGKSCSVPRPEWF